MVSEKTIVILQFAAFCLMATDYYFTEDERKDVDPPIKTRGLQFQKRMLDIQGRALTFLRDGSRPALIVGIFGAMITTWTMIIPAIPSDASPSITTALTIVSMAAAIPAGVIIAITFAVIPSIAALTSAGLGFLIALLVVRSRKGPLFGVGVIFLLTSFACRLHNLP